MSTKVTIDWTAPVANPKKVAAFFKRSLRNLNHLAQITIGDPVKPAERRGVAAQFSWQDIVLMYIGQKLLTFGWSPPRVRRCIEGIREQWEFLIHYHRTHVYDPLTGDLYGLSEDNHLTELDILRDMVAQIFLVVRTAEDGISIILLEAVEMPNYDDADWADWYTEAFLTLDLTNCLVEAFKKWHLEIDRG